MGVVVRGAGTKGKFYSCDLYQNSANGLQVSECADPFVEGCKCVKGKKGERAPFLVLFYPFSDSLHLLGLILSRRPHCC